LRKTDSNRFIFSAYANPLGAVLHKPVKEFLTDVPCAALPVNGGFISQAKENISFHIGSAEILKAGRATASVLGERRDGHYVSLATSTVEKLNILDVITADRVVCRVTSVYPFHDHPRRCQDEKLHPAKFFFGGSHFENLRIDGKHIKCEIETPETEEGFMIKSAETSRAYIFPATYCETHIPQFGSIYLGEKDAYGGKVILTMLRVELGCAHEGSATAGGGSTNGSDAKTTTPH